MEVEPSINYQQRIESKSKPMEEAVKNIVFKYTNNLDTIVHKVRQLLKDDTDILTDQEIDDILLQLPIVLYDIVAEQEVVGIQLDLSNQIYKEAYNEAYKIARGTVGEKQSASELATMVQKMDSLIYDRAYKIIRNKVDMAVETLNAVKKVQSGRAEAGRIGNRF